MENLEVNDVPQPIVTVTQKNNVGALTIYSTTKQNFKRTFPFGGLNISYL